MHQSHSASMALVAAFAIGTAAVASEALAQKPYSAPRDAYGHPDLAGTWGARWLTPLERPAGTPLILDTAGAEARVQQILAARDKAETLDPETAQPDAAGLAVVRGEYRASLLVDPADGRLPLSEAGRAYLAAIPPMGTDGPEQRLFGERCIAGPSRPGMLIAPAVMLKQLLQTRDQVALHSEAFNELRIFAPGGGVQGAGLSTWEGQSEARWEGESLVVESTGARPDERVRGVPYSRFPIRPQTRITERFTRVGPKELLYAFQVDDMVLYTRSWRAEYSFVLTDERMFEFACHEGNYGLANILAGAREEERRSSVNRPAQAP
jgi:hypothetical protein